MAKNSFPEAVARIYNRVFICMRCGTKMRADLPKVRSGKIKCRKCKARQLRAKHKERRV